MNFAYIYVDVFYITHMAYWHMRRISDFSTSVMWRPLKFLHMWRNLQFPHNCHTRKAEISPHDDFFSTNMIRDIRDKYELRLQQHSESAFFGTPCIFLSLSEDVITLTKPFPPGEIAGAQPVIKSGSRKNQRATWEKKRIN